MQRYIEVATDLRNKIIAGTIKPGERIPKEFDLCEQYKVSRITIRRSLQILEDEMLIQRRQGSGTYVSPQPSRKIPLMIDYTGTMREHASKVIRSLILSDWRGASPQAASLLGFSSGAAILYAERMDTWEGTPVAWDQAFILRQFADNLTDEQLARIDFIETWMRKACFTVVSCRQTVEAVAASIICAERLKIRRSAPVLKSTEIYYAEHDQPAGLFLSFYHPDHICIQSRYLWDAARGKPTAGK